MTVRLPLLVMLTAALVFCGEFRSALNKPEIVLLSIPKPAEAVLTAKTLQIKSELGLAPPNRLFQLEQFLRQGMANQFDISDVRPDAILHVSVISYETVKMQKDTVTETRTINVGNDKRPDFESRSVAVVYEVVHGSIVIGVSVVDSTGTKFDSFSPKEEVARRKELTVNGKAPDQAHEQVPAPAAAAVPSSVGRIPGLSALPGLSVIPALSGMSIPKPHLPGTRQAPQAPAVETADGIEVAMIQALANDVRRRYVASTDPVEVALAIDSELRPGDKLAQSGQWKEALDSWTGASLKKNPSDRLYNIAVAKEQLAYAEYMQNYDLEAFLPKFNEAMDLYTQALHGDPTEKYMQASIERLKLAKMNIETARRMKIEQDAASQQAVALATEKARKRKDQAAALADTHPDTPAQLRFRQDVRTQLQGLSGEVPESKRDDLIAFGERRHLNQAESMRVVLQEIKRKAEIQSALQDYENTFKPLVDDGRITSAERKQLHDTATDLNLDPSDVKSVENKYHFIEGSSGHAAQTAKPSGPIASTNPQ